MRTSSKRKYNLSLEGENSSAWKVAVTILVWITKLQWYDECWGVGEWKACGGKQKDERKYEESQN